MEKAAHTMILMNVALFKEIPIDVTCCSLNRYENLQLTLRNPPFQRWKSLQKIILTWYITNLKQNEAQSSSAESTHKGVRTVEFMHLVFTRMPGESYHRRLGSLLLYLCYIFWTLINSLMCWFTMVRYKVISRDFRQSSCHNNLLSGPPFQLA